jgi:hypothetical protein
MSRGLGKMQRYFLTALVELADEKPDQWVRLQQLLERIFSRNADWQSRWQQDQQGLEQSATTGGLWKIGYWPLSIPG